jgi:hypothetical protein
MTIRDFQNQVVAALNGVAELTQHGCKVFAEDMLTTQNDLNNAVATAGRIAVVVVTPRFERDASGCEGGLPAGCDLRVACIEAPSQRGRRDGFTALAAAEAVAHALDGETFEWRSIVQTADERRGVATATAEFGVSIILMKGE